MKNENGNALHADVIHKLIYYVRSDASRPLCVCHVMPFYTMHVSYAHTIDACRQTHKGRSARVATLFIHSDDLTIEFDSEKKKKKEYIYPHTFVYIYENLHNI